MVNFKILLGFLIISFCSCTSAIKNDNISASDEVLSANNDTKIVPIKAPGNTNLIIKNEADIPGFWVGMFEPDTPYQDNHIEANEFYWDYSNKINISIDKIESGKVYGHSVIAGNNRPFEGIVVFENNIYSFSVKEPGNDKHDGIFQFSIQQNDTALAGTWQAFKDVKIPKRMYRLQKRLFVYNPNQKLDEMQERYINWNKKKTTMLDKSDTMDEDGYDSSYFTTTDEISKYNASVQKLTSKQISNMTKADLFILRNAIYARHGYSFKNQQLHAYFDKQPWYIPISTNVKQYLTEIEKANIELLLRYEKNAKEYYDVFGRG